MWCCTGKEERFGAAAINEGPLKDRAIDWEGSSQRIEGNGGGKEWDSAWLGHSEYCCIAQQQS